MRKLFVPLMLFAIIMTACAGTATPDAANETAALEARVAALEAQLAALPAPVVEDAEVESASQAFGVAVAQYVMDTAGFHGMDEALNETQTVDPAYLSTVNRVQKVVAQAPWPEALHEQVEAFEGVLGEFAAALDADDGAAAAPLATELHEVQHDLSHAIDGWLGGEHGHGG
jgi:hypothetical protein